MANVDIDRLKSVIEAVVRNRFDDVEIVAVDIKPDVDEDGDRVLLVEIVFDADSGRLDAGRASGLVRHMLPKIADLGEQAFPILSFISKSDYRNLKAERV